MNTNKLRPLINALCFVAMIVINYLSNSLPLNGRNPAELSDLYPNLFVPAGFTFAIWGIIYLLLLIWVSAQIVTMFSGNLRSKIGLAINRQGWWFAATCLLNIAWIFAWHWQQLLGSVLVMTGLLLALLALNKAINNGISSDSRLEKYMTHIVFGLYQGWITVALIANITATLTGLQWQGAGIAPEVWATVVIAVGAGLAVYMTWQRNILFHGVAVAWALWGIFSKRHAIGDAPLVEYAALAAMAVVLIAVALRYKRWVAY